MENDQNKVDFKDLWAESTKSLMNLWQSSATAYQEILSASLGERHSQAAGNVFSDLATQWSSLFNQETMQNFNDAGAFAEIAASATRTFSEGFSQFQEWMKSAATKDGTCQEHSFVKTQQEIFQKWMEFHEKEIQPLLRIPQVGLTRIYQEKLTQLIERHNVYQAAVADFQYLLCRPMESSLCEMKERLDKAQQGNQAEDFQQYYSMWIKTLERHYMDLFTSSEWRNSLCHVVEEAASFRVSKNEIMMDFMQFLPIPTNRDMDEVYKELYTLKKMVKQLIKKNNTQELTSR